MEMGGLSSSRSVSQFASRIADNYLHQLERSEQEEKTTVEQAQELVTKNVKEKSQEMNDFLVPIYTSLKFTLHDKLEEYYVQVINKRTDEVIREIPPKKFLDMYAAMAEFMGLIVDEKR